MKALTICQPWAEFVLRGVKTVENRPWGTSYRGLLLIHAGKGQGHYRACEERGVMPDGSPVPSRESLRWGCLVGVVDLVDCTEMHPVHRPAGLTPWHEGPFFWELRNPRRFREPIVAKGSLGLWNYPAVLVAKAINTAEAVTPGTEARS